MKTGILKTLAIAGVAACAWAQPASALSIDMTISGDTLTISASGLAGDLIAAWDFDIAYSGAPVILEAGTFNMLGETNVETIAGGALVSPGLLDIFEVSLLSDAALLALQAGADPIGLLAIKFDQDISGLDFRFVWDEFNDVKCAGNRQCFPDQNVPEPGTLALLGIGLMGLGFGRRRNPVERHPTDRGGQ